MRSRLWIVLCLLGLAGAWFLWHRPAKLLTIPSAPAPVAAAPAAPVPPAPASSAILSVVYTNVASGGELNTNRFGCRLNNTGKTIGQLEGDRHAILLENALIDTRNPLGFMLPGQLRPQGDPGAYIVQARGPIGNAFRAALAAAGAQIVSYIPNDAYLVRLNQGGADALAANPLTQAVLAYEPYYKIQSPLLPLALVNTNLPPGTMLTLGLYPQTAAQTLQQIANAGGTLLGQETTSIGTIADIIPPPNWLTVATLPGTKNVEIRRSPLPANDLSRAAVAVAADSQVSSNYMGLTGKNVIVEVNDTGIDGDPTTGHPDLKGRVIGDSALSLVDTNGHGTHVAGTIAGDGTESMTVTNAQGSIMPATNFQFRGMANLAQLYSVAAIDYTYNFLLVSEQYMQAAAALTNAPISNNSWNYGGDASYDLHAASFDAAVRDALPFVTGSQPVLFVFSAGNAGGGDDTGDGGNPDTILSPATAKNVVTVGAVEQLRYITNVVTQVEGTVTNYSTPWLGETDSGYSPFGNSVGAQVYSQSSRGNVGIGVEGAFGRFKPDVVAPGTFVVSTRSQQWDELAYYNPTNYTYNLYTNQIVQTNGLHYYSISVPANAVGVAISVVPNIFSPNPFPANLPLYARLADYPSTTNFDILTWKDGLSLPPDYNGAIADITTIQNGGFFYAVGNTNNFPINYDLLTEIITTNDQGDYFEVLSNLNNSLDGNIPPHWYRYETGTSMAAADVSGVLALISDYFTNSLQQTPSPALLKALLINGSRATASSYDFTVTNSINFEGWGQISLPNSLPPGFTNQMGQLCSSIYIDQSPTNALATGDSHTYNLNIPPGSDAQYLQLQVTLTWTDPPGDPVAAIKLVNNLDLVVSNLDNPTNVIIFYGNDIAPQSTVNTPESPGTNAPPLDYVNNVENVIIAPLLGTNYSITVIGRNVNVNAVTAQTNNVVQDFALVVSCGEGEVTNAFTLTDGGTTSQPTTDQTITFIETTNAPLLNQIVGASTPLLGTNTLPLGTNTIWSSNGDLTIGMTNQWHFYVITNTGISSDFTNAAFITFNAATLSLPRTGVFADSAGDATRPSADIDMYVAGPNDPNAAGLTNLDPMVISNCLVGANGDAASLGLGGTEFVTYTNSAPGEVYYVGVYSEDQMASEYNFIPIFTQIPFSQPGPNGSQIVNGLNVPIDVPDGSTVHPGVAYIFAVAVNEMQIKRVVVTNIIVHQNFGDLIGTLSHGTSGGGASQTVVLNNHRAQYNAFGVYTNIYDDSGVGDIGGAQASDGPGSLNNFVGQEALGPWMLTEVDDALTHTGSVAGFNLLIEPHVDFGKGAVITLEPGTWFVDFISVPAGYQALSISATNISTNNPPNGYATLPIAFYERFGAEPTATAFDQQTDLTNCLGNGIFNAGGLLPGATISTGPPLPLGLYYFGLYNSNAIPQDVYIIDQLIPAPIIGTLTTNGPVMTVTNDAVSGNTIFISSTQQVATANVSLIVTNVRLSDLTFTLISPTGQRILLMENRGGTTATNLGHINITTNYFGTQTAGNYLANTNVIGPVGTSGTLFINYDFYTVPDAMDVYYDGLRIGPNPGGPTSFAGQYIIPYGPGISTNIVIVMNAGNNTNSTTAWEYTPIVVSLDQTYVTFTDNTNLTDIPIKFAIPPYDLPNAATNITVCDFEQTTNGDYFGYTNIFDPFGGWTLPTNLVTIATVFTNGTFQPVTNVLVLSNNEVSVVSDTNTAFQGTNFLALAYGVMQRTIPVTPGRQYSLTYAYRGPGIAGWWRGEGNALDSSDPEYEGNNGSTIGRFSYPAGMVGQAFLMAAVGSPYEFAGTNNYVQVRQMPFLTQVNTNVSGENNSNLVTIQTSSLDVGTGSGFTVEGWINPTNVGIAQPLVEWLARVPTNEVDTNLVIEAGPFLDRATSHYYYLLGSTNWATSEAWAEQLGGHLATVNTANEQNWIYDAFAQYDNLNRNLWIGLTNNGAGGFGWIDGETNVTYTNWVAGGYNPCPGGNDNYAAILGPTNAYPSLWVWEDNNGVDYNGVVCGVAPTNQFFGVVEVTNLQPNGVQLWFSVTNSPGLTNLLVTNTGCLYANLVDITNGIHEIYSAPGLVLSNVYQHVALTYNTNTGVATLYYNGTNVASTNLGVFVPKTTGDLLLGKDMSLLTNNFYTGAMDEMSVYRRFLSDAEISAIYNISAFSTNRNIGKFDPTITPALGLAEAQVSLSTVGTNLVLGQNTNWLVQGFNFTPAISALQLQVIGQQPGLLLDGFTLTEASSGYLYYLPETSLDALNGTSAYGNWTLQIWDNRTGSLLTNGVLVSWQLQITVQTNVPLTLNPNNAETNTIPPGGITYYAITVPIWATSASNILLYASLPVDMLFNQTNPPPGNVPPDYLFLTASTGGSYVMTTAPLPPPQLLPGQTYFLGVRNNNAHSATVAVEVDFNMTTLTNGAPFSDVLSNTVTDVERYYAYDVSSNAVEATFQLLKLSSNVDLVVSRGTPLPTLTSAAYGSFNLSNADENIYVLTNSSPVPLAPGRWYLGVFRRDPGPVFYSVLAKELDPQTGPPPVPNIIPLTNGVPFTFNAGPGAALTNFFKFSVSNTVTSTVTNLVGSIHFELYGMNGNGDLTVGTNAPPLAPPFFQSSQEPGLTPELIYIRTNSALTNLNNTALTNLAGDWYLGVPNHEITNITYTILAVIDTNLAFPAFPGFQGAQGAGAGALGGRGGDVYHVINLDDDGPGSLRYGITSFIGTGATNSPGTGTTNIILGGVGGLTNNSGARTIVFDLSGTINLLSPLVIASNNSYLTIAGQSAPGGGITVAGQMTTVQSAHDVVIRDVRFRRGSTDDSLQFTNVVNVIADHVSAEWSSDNLVSVLNSTNVTVQWSILADSFYLGTNNPQGSLLRYGSGAVSFHHNLYADNYSGNPALCDNLSLDFVNNVIYNWGIASGYSTNDPVADPNGLTNQLNYVCNYLIAGPDTAAFSPNAMQTNYAFYGGTTNTWIFQTNNFIDSDTNGVLNGANTSWAMFTNFFTEFDRPFPLPPVSVDEAYAAYEKVLDFAGVNLGQRDSTDTNIVGKVRSQTGTLIAAQPLAGMVAWWKGESNTLDSVGANNGIAQNITYAAGEVGQAFVFNGSGSSYVRVPASPSLDVGKGNGFTLEMWCNPTTTNFFSNPMTLAEWNDNSGTFTGIGCHLEFYNGGEILGDIVDPATGTDHFVQSPGGNVVANSWQHVAMTYDKTTGMLTLYRNGVVVASGNVGIWTPSTAFDLYFGIRASGIFAPIPYQGSLDEISLYKRVLSQAEIQSIYNAGSAGKFAVPATTLPYLDTDQDGIPDFWEITFGQPPFVPSANQLSTNANYIGYTDLEEYLNWLALPHALTVTNTPVGVDLYQMSGNSGQLSFFVTNAVNGTVYLTNVLGSVTNTGVYSNTIAIFTPFTNYSGYASFDYYVTNNDTLAYFGPVTVSVVVSAVPIVINSNMPPVITPLISGVPSDPTNTGGSDFYSIVIPANAAGALFELDGRTGPMALVVKHNEPLPSLSSYDYLTNAPVPPPDEAIAVLTNSAPVPLAPGTWYMAAVNVSGSNVVYTAKVTLLGNLVPPLFFYPTNTTVTNILETVPYTDTCVATDPDTPPLPLTFSLVSGPAGGGLTVSSTGVINWTPTEAQGPSTNAVQIQVSNGAFSVTNTYTIIVEESNLPPVLPFIPNQVVILPATLVVTNTATDPDIPANPLTYTLLVAPTNAVIDTNGIITWTPTLADVGSNFLFTTVVTDFNPWAVNAQHLSATNSFYVTVLPGATPGGPQTNTVPPGGINWLAVSVPTNALAATNTLLFATNLPVNLWFSTNLPPSITNANDFLLLANVTNGSAVLTTNGTPPLVPGSLYYLGVQNTNAFAVTYALEVTFRLAPPPPSITGLTITATNISGTNGYLLQWQGPADFQYEIQYTTNLLPLVAWKTVLNPVIQVTVTATNGQFSWFDDGSLTGGLGRLKFYRVLGNPNLGPIGGPGPSTNTVLAGTMSQAVVPVPAGALWASNVLLFATGPLYVWYNPTRPPVGNTGAGDILMLSAATSGTFVLNSSSVPPLVTGTNYYLGFQNRSAANVTFAFQVTFGLAPTGTITGLTITATNSGATNGYLLQWQGPTNFLYEIQYTTNLLPLVAWQTVLNPVIQVTVTGTNGHFSWFDDGSLTGGLGRLKFYRVRSDLNLGPITGPGPVTNTVFAGAWSQAVVPVPVGALWASNVLLSATGPLNVWCNPTHPPVGNTNAGDFLMLSAATSGTFVLNSSSVPPLAPGTNYYLAFQNGSAANVTFVFQVTFGLASTAVSGLGITATNSGFLLTWYAATNDLFQVRFTTNLLPLVSWQNFSNIIAYTGPVTPTNGRFTFFDNGSQFPFGPVRFYQLLLVGTATNAPAATNAVSISGAVVTTNGQFQLQWSAPTNYQFQVEWTTNLAPPVAWLTNAGNITSATTNFVFVDTNALTTRKFYRLIVYP